MPVLSSVRLTNPLCAVPVQRGCEPAAFCFEHCDFAIKHFRLYYYLVSPQHSDTGTLFKKKVCLAFALQKDLDQDID